MQLSHRYGGTQLTTRQATPPLHRTCVLHWPYRKPLQQTRRWSHWPAGPQVQEHDQHELLQMRVGGLRALSQVGG